MSRHRLPRNACRLSAIAIGLLASGVALADAHLDPQLVSLMQAAGPAEELQIVVSYEQSGPVTAAQTAALQQLGIAYVSQPTVEMFIPQAINFDLVGGVSFSKGCYPGQEIVARSHYLGKVKRRVFQATATGSLTVTAGQDVWLAGKENEPAGAVATAVNFNGQQYLLVELPVDDAEQSGAIFTVKNDAGAIALNVQPPPYDVHQKGSVFE